MIITENQAKAVRRKQADGMLTAKATAQAIGINPITYKKVVQGGIVKKTVYTKVMEWLAKDY
ncbi:hypothetical protein FIU70_10205 [Streptococcus pneumoniae]|uniref:hypothetical protein n=1 Tax=Streptococcus pneumoniae TaxID=1313 RepID=UPI0010E30097|nr:hypothetical protein [Streptococcus pneumoniae]TNW60285.1 hypothetical protein FIU70_10205 [Streptococcus pneumoniae]VPB52610.1 repressor-related protein [Streptococcus pneumoniae]